MSPGSGMRPTEPGPGPVFPALEHDRLFLNAIITNSDDAILFKTLDGIIRSWNPAAERLFGYSAEEIVGKPKSVLIPPDRLDEEVTILSRLREGLPTTQLETVRARKDGTYFDVSINISPLRDQSGQILGASTIIRDITDRKQASKLATLLSEVPVAINRVNREGIVLDDGTEALRSPFLGDRIQGRYLSEALPPEIAQKVQQYILDALESRSPRSFQYSFSIAGVLRYHDVLMIPQDEDTVLSVVRNITEGVGMAEELRMVVDRYREAQQIARIGSWELDLKTNQVILSEELFRSYGFDPAEGMPTFEQVKSKILPEDWAAYQRLLEEEPARDRYECEMRFLLKDGTIRWGYAIANVVRDDEGHPIRRYGTFMDITEKKRLDDLLREQEIRFRLILDNVPVGIALATLDDQFRHCNPTCARMLDVRPEELTAASFQERTHPEDRQKVRTLWQEILIGQRDSYRIELRFVRPDGSLIWVEEQALAVRNGDSQSHYLLVLLIDITHRKQLETQLLQTQKMESIGRLAGGIAHDYNNLLAVILGYAELIEDVLEPGSEALANIHNIQGAANRATAVTSQLLSFARRQSSRPRVVAPNTLLVQFTRLLKPLLTEEIELVLLLDDDTWNVEIDPNHLEQIIMNLTVNARDAIAHSGSFTLQTDNVTLEAGARREQVTVAPGDYVRLRVTDTGFGMTEEVKNHLFEPFFTTKPVGKGTGLGLATVYGLIKQNRGYIFVESQPGSGATFTIYLPRFQGDIPQEVSSQEPATPLGGNETLLVVEDEPQVREMITLMLRKAGYTVLVASNGHDALPVFQLHATEIDLVITDILMPQMGGIELAQRLKRIEPAVRILLASAYSDQTYTDQIPEGVGFIHKPFVKEAFLRAIRQFLEA